MFANACKLFCASKSFMHSFIHPFLLLTCHVCVCVCVCACVCVCHTGYSDSGKDAGRLAAAWALFEAQENLVSV